MNRARTASAYIALTSLLKSPSALMSDSYAKKTWTHFRQTEVIVTGFSAQLGEQLESLLSGQLHKWAFKQPEKRKGLCCSHLSTCCFIASCIVKICPSAPQLSMSSYKVHTGARSKCQPQHKHYQRGRCKACVFLCSCGKHRHPDCSSSQDGAPQHILL